MANLNKYFTNKDNLGKPIKGEPVDMNKYFSGSSTAQNVSTEDVNRGFMSNFGHILGQGVKNYADRVTDRVGEDINTRVEKMGEIDSRQDTGIIEKTFQKFGQGAGMAANALETVVTEIPGVKGAVEKVGEGINALSNTKVVQAVADKIGGNKTIQELVQLYDTDPNFKDTVDGIANSVRLGLDITAARDITQKGVNTTKSGINEVKNIASDIKQLIPEKPAVVPEPVVPTIDPKVQKIVNKRVNTLSELELNNKPLRTVSETAKQRGIDVKKLVSDTDLLQGSVDATGKIDTLSKGGAIDQFNEFMNKYESAVSDGLRKEGVSMSFDKVKARMLQAIDDSKLAGGSKLELKNAVNREIEGLIDDVNPNGTIDLAKLQDAKISTTKNLDYSKPLSKENQKAIGNIYKTLIEENSSLPVQKINAELSKYYSIEDYLQTLHGKTVKGGKLGKYFAQTVGGMAGSHFGPLGTIIGAELGGLVKGSLFESTFGGVINSELKATKFMDEFIKQNKEAPKELPAAGETGKVYENNLGNLNNAQTTNTINNNATIPPKSTTFEPKSQTGKFVKQVLDTPNKEGGFVAIPGKGISDNLLNEAKKYKSAEEFVKATESLTPKKRAEMATKLIGQKVQFRTKTGGKIFYDSPNDFYEIVGVDNLTKPSEIQSLKDFSQITKVRAKTPTGEIRDFDLRDFSGFTTKSQLTDIWNKANTKSISVAESKNKFIKSKPEYGLLQDMEGYINAIRNKTELPYENFKTDIIEYFENQGYKLPKTEAGVANFFEEILSELGFHKTK